jgi:hypothetical protein
MASLRRQQKRVGLFHRPHAVHQNLFKEYELLIYSVATDVNTHSFGEFLCAWLSDSRKIKNKKSGGQLVADSSREAASRMQICIQQAAKWSLFICHLAASRMQIVPGWPSFADKFPPILLMLHLSGSHPETI